MATLAEAISNIERRTGVPKGFFETLKAEDDWSFVIKSHALIEAACAEFLTARFGDYELLEVFSRLELSNKRTGKIAFLKELSLLNDDERRFVTELSELRNVLVHNVKNTMFDLRRHVAAMNKQQHQNFVNGFGSAFLPEEKGIEHQKIFADLLANPKDTIWRGLKVVLAIISLQIETIELKRAGDSDLKEIGRHHLAKK